MKKRKKKTAAKRNKKTTPKPKHSNRPVTTPRTKKRTTTAKVRSRPAKAAKPVPKPALMAVEATDGIPSLPRLRQILGEYYQPVVDYEPIGNRVPFPTLTRRINDEWNLAGVMEFQPGEINRDTVVIDLSRDIDNRATQ